MCAGHNWCHLSDTTRTQPMYLNNALEQWHNLLDWSAQPTLKNEWADVHKPQHLRVVYNQHRWSNVHKPQLMWAINDQCRLAYLCLFRWPTFLTQTTPALVDCACHCRTPMYPNRCGHAMTHACKTWMMSSVVGLRHLPDANMQRPMHGPLEAFDSVARISTYWSRHHFFQRLRL